MDVKAGELLRMTRQALVMRTKETDSVNFTFGETVTASATAAETGKAKVEKELGGLFGEKVDAEFALGGSFVADYLSRLDSDADVRIEWVDTDSALKFTSANRLYILMPLSRGS